MNFTIPGTGVVCTFSLDPNGNVTSISIPYGPDAPQVVALNPSITVSQAEALAEATYNLLNGN